MTNFLSELRLLNIERQKEWDPENKATLSFKGLEFAGEAGELASKIKKLARKVEFEFVGSDYDMKDIEEEVGDVLITLDLVCQKMGIDIEKVTKEKFNATSEKMGMDTKFTCDSYFENFKRNIELRDYSLTPFRATTKDNKELGIFFDNSNKVKSALVETFFRLYPDCKYKGSEITFTNITEQDITVPERYRVLFANIKDEPYVNYNSKEEKLYCLKYNGEQHYFYCNNGENVKNYFARTKITRNKIDDFWSEAQIYVTHKNMLC